MARKRKTEGEVHHCPICGAENPEKLIRLPGGGILGCDICLCIYDAWEYFEEG